MTQLHTNSRADERTLVQLIQVVRRVLETLFVEGMDDELENEGLFNTPGDHFDTES